MSEWREYQLDDVAVINPSESLKKGELARKVPMEYLSPFTKKVSGFSIESYDGGMKFRNGDTIIARITPSLENGKTAFIDFLDNDEIAFGSTEFIVLREKEKLSDKHFLYYFAISPEFRDVAILSMTGSSGRQRVQTDVVREHTFLLPPLPEQKAIATVLSSLDDKIDLLHRQNKTLEAMAETLFRQWFVEPAHRGGEADESWEEVELKELVFHIKPGTNSQPKRVEKGISFLNVRNLNNGFVKHDDTTKVDINEYYKIHKNWQPEENDVLISRIGTLGIVAVLTKEDLPLVIHYNMLNLKPKLVSYQFLFFLLKSSFFQEKYFANARQSVQEYLAIEDVEAIKIYLPLSDPSFRNKEKILNELFDKKYANHKKIQTLEKLRDTLLPKLMSGEVRVLH